MKRYPRKTAEVREIVQNANSELRCPKYDVMYKKGIVRLLVRILHATGNYKGFQYVYIDKERPTLPDGTTNPNFTEEHQYCREYFI